MVHKGIENEIEPIDPGLWKYRFRRGAVIRTGRTKCLAHRRVQMTIDRLLRTPHGRSQNLRSRTGMAVLDIKGSERPPQPVKTRGPSP